MNKKTLKMLKIFQKEEITAKLFYLKLSRIEKNKENSEILARFSQDEMTHYDVFRKYSGIDVKPDRLYAGFVVLCARFLGMTFVLKMLEKVEAGAQAAYKEELESWPEMSKILEDEERHEHKLLSMLQEERLEYVGSVVLGLNDALVELTGALAGLTFAFQNTRLIAITGLITGIAASFSMASSEFLSHRAEENSAKAAKASLYTGIAYIVTVILLILPYLLIAHYVVALITTLTIGILIIASFNFYISVAKELSFSKHFWEMTAISLGVSALSFGVGVVVRIFFGIDL
jgi:VIT1/CCC1 family predicted Fe2+/Mn2+ transporter